MKVTEINKLIKKHLQSQLSSYYVHRDLIYKVENVFFMKGYAFESTGNGEYDLAVWCFIQPLFVKSDCLYFNFGDRLKYEQKIDWLRTKKLEWWDATKEKLDASFQSILQSILKDGEKYLYFFKTPEDFYNKFKPDIKDDIRAYEAIAYTSVLLKDELLQNKMLKGLIEFSLRKENKDDESIELIREDATLLLNADTQEKRLEILREWTNETLEHLKLPDVPKLM